MATVLYPGLYRAKAVRLEGDKLIAFVPQVFGETSVTIQDFVGAIPTTFDMGWVAFHGGHADYPVWMGAGSSSGGGGTVTDTLWVGPSAPTDTSIELWYDTDEVPVDLDATYVNVNGDTMTGALTVGAGAGNNLTSPYLRVRNGNSIAATSANQILFGYSGGDNFSHALATQHDSGGIPNNKMLFKLWKPGDFSNAPSNIVMTLAGDSITAGVPVVLPSADPTGYQAVSKTFLDTLLTPAWTDITLATNWTNYGAPWQTAQYRRIGDLVYLRGLIKCSDGSTPVIATLTAGIRPASQLMWVSWISANAGAIRAATRVELTTGGALTWANATSLPTGTTNAAVTSVTHLNINVVYSVA